MNGKRATTRVCVLATVTALALAACSGGGAAKRSSHAATRLVVSVGTVQVESAGPPARLPEVTRDEILATVRDYVERATVQPIESGKPVPTDIARLFTADAAARVSGRDRASWDTLVDDGVPRATGRVTTTVAPTNLTALTDASGAVVLVSATLGVDARADTARGKLQVQRSGELVFAPVAGAWKIFGFDVSVQRAGAALSGAKAAGS